MFALVIASLLAACCAWPESHIGVAEQINQKLLATEALRTVPCDGVSVFALRVTLKAMLALKTSPITASYPISSTEADMKADWQKLPSVQPGDNADSRLLKYAHCHEAVMWFLHHLSLSEQQAFSRANFLPLLPLHELPVDSSDPLTLFYASKVNCEECHSGFDDIHADAAIPLVRVNQKLLKQELLRTVPCEHLSIFALRVVLKALLNVKTNAGTVPVRPVNAESMYPIYKTEDEMQEQWSALPGVQPGDNADSRLVKYSHCHEAVSWFFQHLSMEERKSFAKSSFLPLLPVRDLPHEGNDALTRFYTAKVKCQRCSVDQSSLELQFV